MTRKHSPPGPRKTGPQPPGSQPPTSTELHSEAQTETRSEPTLRGKPIRPPGPRGCRRYMRERLAAALPYISDRLLEDAAGGKLAALKLAVHISGLDEKGSQEDAQNKAGKAYIDLLREDWQKEPIYVHPRVHPYPLEFHPPENPDELVCELQPDPAPHPEPDPDPEPAPGQPARSQPGPENASSARDPYRF